MWVNKFQNLTKLQKLLVFILPILLIFIIFTALYFTSTYTAKVKILIAPKTAELYIDGKKYKNSDNFTANYDSSGENIYIKSSIFNNKLKYTGVGIGFLIILVAFMKWLAYFLNKDKKRNEAKTKIAKEMKKKSKDKMKKKE